MTALPPQDHDPLLLSPEQIEQKLALHPEWKDLLHSNSLCLIFRNQATWVDPIYEIQMGWQLDERFESVAWLWVDALDGSVIQCHWE